MSRIQNPGGGLQNRVLHLMVESRFEKYGTVNKFQGAYSWEGSITRIALRYDEPTKLCLLTIESTKLASQEVKDIFEKDKD
jgi:hypothetical protein